MQPISFNAQPKAPAGSLLGFGAIALCCGWTLSSAPTEWGAVLSPTRIRTAICLSESADVVPQSGFLLLGLRYNGRS